MIVPCLLALLAAETITINTRVPAVLLVISPKETPVATPTSTYLEVAGELLAHHTRLELLSLERAGADASLLESCSARDRMSCWLRAATAGTNVRYVFVLAAHPRDADLERLTLLAFDAARARTELATPRSTDDLENALYALAIHSSPRDTTPKDLRAYFEHALFTELGPAFDRKDFTPFGHARVELPNTPVAIQLDGAPPIETGGGTIHLRDLDPGPHALAIREQTIPFTIEPAKTTTIAGIVFPPPDREPAPIRTAAQLASAAILIAGGAISTYAIATRGDLRHACLVHAGSPGSCPDPGEPTFAREPGAAPSVAANDVNPSGVLVLPLGLAALTTGAVLGTATLVFDATELEDTPRFLATLAIALASGAAVYATGVLADAR